MKNTLGIMVILTALLLLTMAALFIYKKDRTKAHRVAGFWLLVLFVLSMVSYYEITYLDRLYPVLLGTQGVLAINVFFNCAYGAAVLAERESTCWRSRVTLLPFILFITYYLLSIYPGSLPIPAFIFDKNYPLMLQLLAGASIFLVVAQNLRFLWQTTLFQKSAEGYAKKELDNFKNVLLAVLTVYFFIMLSQVIKPSNDFEGYYAYFLCLVMVFSTVGIAGYYMYRQKCLCPLISRQVKIPGEWQSTGEKKNKNDELFSTIYEKIVSATESNKLYLFPGFCVSKLAIVIDENPSYISEAIKRYSGCNFLSFVNKYRVMEAKKMMSDPAYSHYSLVSIGMEAGFNSKSTFNRVFKKEMGITPSEYQGSQQAGEAVLSKA